MKLKIGANEKPAGYKTLDINPITKPDYLYDITKRTKLRSESCEEILCEDVLEHLQDPMAALREMYRLLKRTGVLKLRIPHALNPCFYGTPDHIHGWTYVTPQQFWRNSIYNSSFPKFKCIHRRLVLRSKFWQFLADRFPVKTEYLFFILHPDYIEAEMMKL